MRHTHATRVVTAIIGCLVLLGGQTHAWAKSDNAPESQTSLDQSIAQLGQAATVGISCSKDEYASFFGTGVIVAKDGYILTSTTVVPDGSTDVKIYTFDHAIHKAQIVATNADLEITLLKADASDLTALPIADGIPAVGEFAYTLGNAHNVMARGGRAPFSRGRVSGIYHVENSGGESVYEGLAIETSAAINPGSDGGPMMNRYGQLCGIISLNVSMLRWQGLAVPMPQISKWLKTVKDHDLKIDSSKPFKLPKQDPSAKLANAAKRLAKTLVGIDVEREFKPEALERLPWGVYVKSVKDFDKKTLREKVGVQRGFYDTARLLEVNQMLRRPKQPVTGVLISKDGLILTSSFNVGSDLVFKDKETGKPREFQFTHDGGKLFKSNNDTDRGLNDVKKIRVTLHDGRAYDATVVAKHLPMGVALLKIDATDLACLDIKDVDTDPKLGQAVGVLGYVGGDQGAYSLNSGIVSSPKRDRGFTFQVDALLNYGNSGGLVISDSGKFMGVAGAPIEPSTVIGRLFKEDELEVWEIAPNSGVGKVTRADQLFEVLEALKKGETTERLGGAFLGIGMDQERAFGNRVFIGSVLPNSAAAKAGLKRGDRIDSLDGKKIESWGELTDYIFRKQPGDTVKVDVYRKNMERHLLVGDKKIATQKDLVDLLNKLKNGEEITGKVVKFDRRTLDVVLGERK